LSKSAETFWPQSRLQALSNDIYPGTLRVAGIKLDSKMLLKGPKALVIPTIGSKRPEVHYILSTRAVFFV
jgi:hypothetical protein